MNEIIQMHVNGETSDAIVNQVKSRGIAFEVTLPIMEEMIKKGVSQGVLAVLLGHDPSRVNYQNRQTTNISGQAGITVSTDPPGLSLTIDGKDQGVTPGLSNKIEKGKHLIKVDHPLFFSRQEEVEFDGKTDLFLKWKMEPREPIVRVSVNIDRGSTGEPWSWIIRPRNHCPGCEVDIQLKPWQPIAKSGEALFLLEDASKRLYRGKGTACLELNIWRGEVRRDLPMRRLPPPTMRYYLTDIQISGIKMNDMTVDVKIKELDQTRPEIEMRADSGYLISADEESNATPKGKTYESVIDTLDGFAP